MTPEIEAALEAVLRGLLQDDVDKRHTRYDFLSPGEHLAILAWLNARINTVS